MLFHFKSFYIAQPVAGLKRELEGGGRCTARCWKMKKGCAEIKMWGKCGVQIAKMWCLGLVLNNPFCGAKFSKFGVKIMVFGCEGC